MDSTTQILSALLGVAMVILIAPGILRFNQGKILRNIALWLAIFLGLALVYQTFGPENLIGGKTVLPASKNADGEDGQAAENDSADTPDSARDEAPQGYNPPNEN